METSIIVFGIMTAILLFILIVVKSNQAKSKNSYKGGGFGKEDKEEDAKEDTKDR